MLERLLFERLHFLDFALAVQQLQVLVEGLADIAAVQVNLSDVGACACLTLEQQALVEVLTLTFRTKRPLHDFQNVLVSFPLLHSE